jgi:hypothetical protein
MEIPIRNTIFLQGIFFSQVRTLEDHMIEENIARDEQPLFEAPLPTIDDIRVTRFRNKKQWAESYKDTTLKCWYCGLSFKGLPCFIPMHIRNTPQGKEYDTHGLFCGFACAFTYLKNQAEFIRNKTYFDKLCMLKMLFTIFYNKRVMEFKEAPYIYDLTLYGGHVDIVEYRNNLRAINTSIISEAKYIQSQN